MDARTLKKKYLSFFRGKKHAIISSSSLIPEHDPTVLFTTAGMHPLVPYLMGQPHPQGKRVVNVQKCIRTVDIDNVGDATHLTFFEMLGNWSFGDYFKKEAIEWSHEFLTSKKWLGFDAKRLHITCFKGDSDAPKDTESASAWESVGIPKERIHFLPKEDNWWGPAGQTGPCGPCSEMFIDTRKSACSKSCKPGCGCGKYFEIWNDVFMEFNKKEDGTFEALAMKSVDTGMGVERTIAMLAKKKNVFATELFLPILHEIEQLASKVDQKSVRIIADHLKSAVFILGDQISVVPSNLDQGYILRRFVRRAIRHGRKIGIADAFCKKIVEVIISVNQAEWPELKKNKKMIIDEITNEEEHFGKTLEKGLRKFESMTADGKIDAREAFFLFQSFGFPIEMTQELAGEKKISVDVKGFEKEFEKHQELSRKGAEKRFTGGLGDHSEATTRLHTATHLLNEALKEILGSRDIQQKGSNITSERLRFDFSFDRKLTDEEKENIEKLVNKKIKDALVIERKEMTVTEAKKVHAEGVFGHKYSDRVFVYFVGDFSTEICGGPHVANTKELGTFKIKKEESVAAGVRRIKAVLV